MGETGMRIVGKEETLPKIQRDILSLRHRAHRVTKRFPLDTVYPNLPLLHKRMRYSTTYQVLFLNLPLPVQLTKSFV
jgi:NAD-dependent oxidoreductase involved in siderophore biosynthesis